MKHIFGPALLLATSAVSAAAQPAPAAPASATSQVCIDTTRIDHTSVPDSRTILFYMRDGKVWKNTLRQSCPLLKFNGFAYDSTPDHRICSNMQIIRVLRSGAVCSMGAFEPYTPPAKASDRK